MALHELATNSFKYGALSVEGGRVAIAWDCDETCFRIGWRESGGPRVKEPARRGFGTTLIERIPRRSLDADVRLEFDPGGISWEFRSNAHVLARVGGLSLSLRPTTGSNGRESREPNAA